MSNYFVCEVLIDSLGTMEKIEEMKNEDGEGCEQSLKDKGLYGR